MGAALLRVRRLDWPPLPSMNWWFRALFAGYGAIYLLHALAPEIQPDAVTYHLGIVYEYVRLHALSGRADFYELLPQGVEMLFVPAFAIGLHSAAKLVHCSFLVAAVSIIRHICRELNIPDAKACCAAAIFLIAPVTAVDATSAYTDAALVCCCCVVFYLALCWECLPEPTLLVLAGLNAGFCYAIKPTFGWIVIAALAFFLLRSKKVATLLQFTGAASVGVLPWMLRSLLLTGNPVAPFLNAWFPNSAFTAGLEAQLVSSYSALRPSFSWRSAIADYTILGGNQGMLGPAFLLMPVAVFALRTRAGRWLLAVSLLLAAPVLANTGTRFLLPAAAIGMIALVSMLPLPLAAALVVVQMVGSLNPVIDLYDSRNDWRLHDIPWRAALRLEDETAYRRRNIAELANDTMIAENVPQGARVYALAGVHEAYLPREALVYWQSSLADRILDRLELARESQGSEAELLSWRWPAGAHASVRVTPASGMRILAAQFDPGSTTVSLHSGVSLKWTNWKAGEIFNLEAPPGAAGLDMLVWPLSAAMPRLQGIPSSGAPVAIDGAAQPQPSKVNIQRDVTAFILRSGYRYILVSAEKGSFAALGRDMRDNPARWGLQPVDRADDIWLFRIEALR